MRIQVKKGESQPFEYIFHLIDVNVKVNNFFGFFDVPNLKFLQYVWKNMLLLIMHIIICINKNDQAERYD